MSDPARARRILKQHVMTEQLLGVASVPMDHAAVPVAMPPQAAPAAMRGAASPPRPAPPPRSSQPPRAPASPSRTPVTTPLMVAATEDAPAVLETAAKLQVLQALDASEVQSCTRCALSQSRTRTVFGEGSPDARIMFVGEGPGQTEDEQGRPFVGRAGELLEKQIGAMGLQREDVYIANVVKCRPPGNRTPMPDEVGRCAGYLMKQIEVVRPEVIVTLGGPAAKMILGASVGITRLRGQWGEYRGIRPSIPVMPTFHPAYLLRSYTVENRKKVWSDLQAVMQRLGIEK